MVINKNGLITENQETQDNNLIDNHSKEIENISITNNNITDSSDTSDTIGTSSNNSDNCAISVTPTNEELENTSNDTTTEESEQKETAETNCLALTVRKNYNVSIIKNSIFTSLRLSFKVAISTLVLNILKLFL